MFAPGRDATSSIATAAVGVAATVFDADIDANSDTGSDNFDRE